MRELPVGWTWVSISDVTEKMPNVKPQDYPDKEFRYVDISSICNSTYQITEVKRFKGADAPSRARRPIRPNDILFSNVRTYLRNITIVPQDTDAQICSTGFTVLRPRAGIDPQFLFRYVLTNDFIDRVTPQQTGTHYPATSDRVVISELIPLPPLNEQRRIVAKLEELLGKVEACQKRLAKIPVLLKRFRQSVLAAACSGRLTAEWRGGDNEEPGLPHGWEPMPLEDLLEKGGIFDGPFGSKLKTEDYAPSGVRVVRLENIGHLRFFGDKKTYITKEKFGSLIKHTVGYGDIIFSSFIADEIRACLLPQLDTKAIAKADCFCLRANKKVVNRGYLTFQLVSQESYSKLIESVHGATRPRINTTQLRKLEIRICPLEEQKEIVSRVEALLKFADQIEARYKKAQEQVYLLTQSILAKAFRGELVPTEAELARREGRDCEPASALLDRVLKDRAYLAKRP